MNKIFWWFDSKTIVDTIYDKSTWSDLTDFTNHGSTVSVSSNELAFSGGAGTFTQSLGLTNTTKLAKWSINMRYKVGSKDATSYGAGLGIRSTNSTANKFNLSANLIGDTGADSGKLRISRTQLNLSVNNTLSSSAISFSVNDVIDITFEYDSVNATVTAYNVTTSGSPISLSVSFPYSTSVVPTDSMLPNTGRFSIFSFGGNFNVTKFTVTSNEIYRPSLMFIGDSITQRYFSSGIGKVYSEIVSASYSRSSIYAGGGDTTAEVLTNITEIINLIKPSKVYLQIGINDVAGSIAYATYTANYASIVSQLEASGITVVHSTLCYNTSTDPQPFRNYVLSNYSYTKIIDTQTCVVSLVDGLHPNDSGHSTLAAFIIASGKLESFPAFSIDNLDIISHWDNGSSYMASDGSAWTDRKGLYSLTASGTGKPTYNSSVLNSRPSFTFDGINDVFTGGRITQIQGKKSFSFWAVGKRFVWAHDNNTTLNYITINKYPPDDKLYSQLATVSLSGYGSSPSRANDYQITIVTMDLTASSNALKIKSYLNGVQETLTFTGAIPSATENQASSILEIGKGSDGTFQAGELLECGIINRPLSADDVASLNSYLSSKYAI